MDRESVKDQFNITFNGDLMISKMKPEKTGKEIRIYSEMAQKCIDLIEGYAKDHNLAMVADKNRRDGWRVEIKTDFPSDPHVGVNTEYSRKFQCNLFAMNKVNIFHNGFDRNGVEWMKTRKQTKGKKYPGEPFPHSIKFRSEKEAINFEKSCNTNFYNNILYLLKHNSHIPLRFLPWMGDYSHPWTDDDYCRFFAKIGMDRECQKWMCRDVYDYRIKDYIKEEHKLSINAFAS